MRLVKNFAQLTAVFALTNLSAFAQPTSGLAAHWEGAIQMPERELRIRLDLAKNSKGEWTGSFSIPSMDGNHRRAPDRNISQGHICAFWSGPF